MHILVTDLLTCVRCGPDFGLILLAEEITERRVIEGHLGCPNCRERYPVEGGFCDLRPAPRSRDEVPSPGEDDPEGAFRVGALLGVREGPGLLLLTGSAARFAERLAAMIEGVEVVTAHPGLRAAPEAPGVSRISVAASLPFRSGGLRGVVLEGEEGLRLLGEGARVLGRGGRIVLFQPPPGASEALEGEGLELLLDSEAAVVAARN